MPCWFNAEIPFPAINGFGSGTLTITFLILLAMMRSVQGGVFPVMQHGSNDK
jgi:hypothetical protein